MHPGCATWGLSSAVCFPDAPRPSVAGSKGQKRPGCGILLGMEQAAPSEQRGKARAAPSRRGPHGPTTCKRSLQCPPELRRTGGLHGGDVGLGDPLPGAAMGQGLPGTSALPPRPRPRPRPDRGSRGKLGENTFKARLSHCQDNPRPEHSPVQRRASHGALGPAVRPAARLRLLAERLLGEAEVGVHQAAGDADI